MTGFIVCCSSCDKKKEGRNFLFDMGPDSFPVEQGFVRVDLSQQYDSVKGYGWLHAPVSAFDTSNNKLHKQSLRSGVWGKDSIVFRADLPDGSYNLILSVGNKDSVNMKMQVFVDDELLSGEVTAPWYRLPYKTIRRKYDVDNGKIEIKIRGAGTDVGLYSLELRAATSSEKLAPGLEEDTVLIKNLRTELVSALAENPGDIGIANQVDIVDKYLLACSYYDGGGWSWASKATGFSLIYRMYAAADLLEQIISDPDDPLYERSMYLLARIYYWLDKEDSNSSHERSAREIFERLKEKYPENKIVRMYLDEKIVNDEYKAAAIKGNAPEWAIYQQEAMGRLLELIHWWVINKQAPNGEMGGKYGDDVELLRWWLPAVLGTDDSIARLGYTRLADGVWNSGILERGFAKKIDDVEHSAELFRDTHPGMFLVKYGDPEYVERCLTSMKNFRDVWTGITSLGHRHFKSYYLSAAEVAASYPYDVDVALNARALLPGLWAAWYSGNPTIMRLFNKWCKAWIEDAARASNGKPAGVLPSAVAFDGDRIGGHSKKWYDPELTYDYYNWDHVGHVNELQYHLIGMYKITGDPAFLKTINFYNDLLLEAKRTTSADSSSVPGALDWVKWELMRGGEDGDTVYHPMGKLLGMARQLTSQNRYDSLVLTYGHPYNRYLLTHDTADVIAGLKNIIEILRYNWPLLTGEVKFTDRVYVPGSNLLTGMYTGHFGAGYEFPALAVSWKNTGRDLAVFVQNSSNKGFQTLLYNFGKERELGMRTWQLEPGIYHLQIGTDLNGDGMIDELIQASDVELKENVNDLAVKVPSGKTILLKIGQVKAFAKVPAKTDLAINARDITVKNPEDQLQLSILVHNIGNQPAKKVRVSFSVEGQQPQTFVVPQIDAPNNLDQQTKPVIFLLKPFTGSKKMVLTVNTDQPEITTLNNKVEATLQASDGQIRVSL